MLNIELPFVDKTPADVQHAPGLPDPVTAILGLKVVVRVVVYVVQNDLVRRRQVYAQPAGFRGQQEDEYVRIAIESIDEILSERKTGLFLTQEMSNLS